MADTRLRAADSEQAERLHTFAHDLKNRLGGLWEVLRLLHTGKTDEQDRDELFAFAERGFFNAQRDLEALLDDLRVERGMTIPDPAPFDVSASLREAITNEGYRLEKKAQHVETAGAPTAVARGDARWTTQLLQALISNSSKYSPRGSPIRAEVMCTTTDVRIRFSDSGCGLTPDDLRQVFTRYAMLSSHSTDGEPQSRGTLGRAHQWAEAQGGTLIATSDGPGKGSTFTLTLPIG